MTKILLLVFVILLWPVSATAQIVLNGSVEDDAGNPVIDTQIGVVAGPSEITDSKGQFSIKLPRDFIEGERVIFTIFKKNWVINHPLDGEWNLPNSKYQNVHTTKVVIVPKGSKKLWTHERIEKYISKLSDELTQDRKEGDKPKRLDFTYYLDEWAKKYGFTPTEVKRQFDQWAKQAEGSEDKRLRALAEFYNKNFEAAAKLFEEAAGDDEAELKKAQKEIRLKVLRAYKNRKDAGNSLSAIYQFREALGQYLKAQSLLESKTMFPLEWAKILILIGNARSELGVRTEGGEAKKFLTEAVLSYRAALEVYTRKDFPQQWATTQNNLGIAFLEQGIRTAGEESTELLAEAVEIYRAALEVYTRKDFPQQWASTQTNLGIVLSNQGVRTAGDEGARLRAEAVQACRNALEVYTRKDFPQQWASTQTNLGIALWNQSMHIDGPKGTELLAEAVQVYRATLEVYTRKDFPQQWAMTQTNLGTALRAQGVRTAGKESTELLAEAVQVYRAALEVYTRKDFPQQWATTQNNLGNVRLEQGIRTAGVEGTDLLAEAVHAYRATIEVRTRKDLPQDWAMTQNNLGITYEALKDWSNAALSYAHVLEIYPDYGTTYQKAAYLYQEILFDFPKAYELNASWLQMHPEDLSARSEFAERQFTNARFSDSLKSITALLTNPALDSSQKICLHVIEIADIIAISGYNNIQSRLETLRTAVAAEPKDFRLCRSFQGTKHFINQYEPLTPYREFMISLFGAFACESRDAILSGLRAIVDNFPECLKNQ